MVTSEQEPKEEAESWPTMAGPFETSITPSYLQLKAINIGVPRIRDGAITPGLVTVTMEGDPDFTTQGTLSPQGILSGMAKLHYQLALVAGDILRFSIPRPGRDPLIVVHPMPDGRGRDSTPSTVPSSAALKRLFTRKGFRHIHIEPFRPEGLGSWEPKTETDVYLAFGVLQEYTNFRYCCGTSSAILAKLGADYSGSSKPDAILIDRTTDEYLMAEWKMNSSAFKSNHSSDDVDVLVCWLDDETNRSVLPPTVLSLFEIARMVAAENISGA